MLVQMPGNAGAGGVVAALTAVRALAPDVPCEVECTEVEQVEQAAAAGAELILLDNMDLDAMRASKKKDSLYGARDERGHRVDDDDVHRVGAHQDLDDLEGLFAIVGLRDQQVIEVDANGKVRLSRKQALRDQPALADKEKLKIAPTAGV